MSRSHFEQDVSNVSALPRPSLLQPRIVLYSKERIELGEEITYNYMFDYEEDRANAIQCCCGAKKCTGWLN